MNPHSVLSELVAGRTLSERDAEGAFEAMLGGAFDDSQIAGVLSLIQSRGATVDELVGAARVMRRHVTPVRCGDSSAVVIDTCGTGGAPKTFNISTAAAIVVAAAGKGRTPRVVVAKHGNRSRSGRGSAEVLERLGVNVNAGPEVQGRCLTEAGVCFCFAIHHHPAAKAASGPRRSLGFPTLFNLLGPLTNPAGASRQIIGIYSRPLVELAARALHRLGSHRAMVVHGSDGMDELTTAGVSWVGRVEPGGVRLEELDPAGFGLPRPSAGALLAADLDAAARMIGEVLDGQSGPARDIVVLNSGAALHVAGACGSIADGMGLAAETIDSGRAASTLNDLARLSRT